MLAWFISLLGKIQWESLREKITGRRYNLTYQDWHSILQVLREKPRIILTYRKAHLSTWLVRFVEVFLNKKWGTYGHVLVSYVDSDAAIGFDDFKFIEAVGKGVISSPWHDIFNADGVCVLDITYATAEQLILSIQNNVLDDLGKKYDDYQNPFDDSKMSCVEIGKELIEGVPDSENTMRVFNYMVNRKKRLSPDMFRDCPELKVILEIKK